MTIPLLGLLKDFLKVISEDVLFPTVCNMKGKEGGHMTVIFSCHLRECCGLRSAMGYISQGCGQVHCLQELGSRAAHCQFIIIDC